MSIGKALGRVGIVLSVAVAVGLLGCDGNEENNPGGGGGGGGGTYTVGSVTINGLTWTDKNININTANSWCYGYEDSSSYCAKYGRLYTWEAAKSACASLGGGWRLPTREDWNNLVEAVGGEWMNPSSDWYNYYYAGTKLKSTSGWYDDGNGTDDYGFSALPGGGRYSDGNFYGAGNNGNWWSATEYGSGSAYFRYMSYGHDDVNESTNGKSNGFSVRCVGVAQ